MTGRTCPVHGEYSASGVCRWCEPLPAPDALPPLPEGHTRCRCGRMAWTEYAPRPFHEEYDGMVHSPEQCYAVAATPPAEPVSLPGLKGPWQKPDRVEVNEAGVPTYTFILSDKTEEAYVWRLEWTEPVISEDWTRHLLAQHAALRWERVARRWNYKHRRPGGADEDGRARVWMHWLQQMDRRFPRGWS